MLSTAGPCRTTGGGGKCSFELLTPPPGEGEWDTSRPIRSFPQLKVGVTTSPRRPKGPACTECCLVFFQRAERQPTNFWPITDAAGVTPFARKLMGVASKGEETPRFRLLLCSTPPGVQRGHVTIGGGFLPQVGVAPATAGAAGNTQQPLCSGRFLLERARSGRRCSRGRSFFILLLLQTLRR